MTEAPGMSRSTLRIVLVTASGLVLFGGLITAIVIYSGAYDVSATTDHSGPIRWVLATMRDRSVSARADDAPEPVAVDAEGLAHGFQHYRAMCVQCHGAPGVERGELGQGVHPTPPDLAEQAPKRTDRELFWITKHGIKMAGMPAFGPTHSDEEIWGIVAFVRELSRMSPEDYGRWEASAGHAAPAGHTSAGDHALAGDPAAVDGHAASEAAHQPMAGMEHAAMELDGRGSAPQPGMDGHADHGAPATPGPTSRAVAMPGMAPGATGHEAMDHGGAAAPEQPAPAAAQPEHAGHPGQPAPIPTPSGAPPADRATQRLLDLARELVRDPVVQREIREDPVLNDAWADPELRRVIEGRR